MLIQGLSVSYRSGTIYDNFSICFTDNTVTAILGPSGCGKTTLLNAIAFGGQTAHVSYIFQEPRLLPWYTLERNIMLVLGEGNSEYKRKISHDYLVKVGLGKRAGEYPDRLSGGERQRASVARAFASQAPVLLMDEPFQSQDPGLKNQLIGLVRELQSNEKRTIIAVTHDVQEATALADRAIILNGRPVSVILDIPVTPDSATQISEVLACQTSML